MRAPVTASERDLRTLAGIVSDDRGDLRPKAWRRPCSVTCGTDPLRSPVAFRPRLLPAGALVRASCSVEAADDGPRRGSPFWKHYWGSVRCSYPDRTGDLRSVTKISDFYSARQWHSTGMYQDSSGRWSMRSCCACPLAPGGLPGPGRPCG